MRALVSVVLLGMAGLSQAATVVDCGPTICYEYDDAQIAAGSSYFGTPTLIGDDMRFLPTTFLARSVDGVGDNSGTNTDVYGTTFVFDRIYSVSGQDIQSISVIERGDYSIVTDGSVQADLLMLVANNNDATECECDIDTLSVSGASSLTTWEMTAAINPLSVFDSPANDVSLSLQDTLTAFTDAAGETAWIQKKFVSISVTAVPLPAAVWMMLSGLGLLLTRARLRSF